MATWRRGLVGLLVGPLLATVLGCATVGQFRAGMDSFIGRPIREAQETFGYGYALRELEDGGRAYTWQRVQTGVLPGYESPTTVESYTTREGDIARRSTTVFPGTYYPPEQYRNTCEFTLITDGAGTIVRWHAQGNGCKGYPGGPVLRSH